MGYKKRIEDAWNIYAEIVVLVAEQAFKETVLPFLKENGYELNVWNEYHVVRPTKERPIDGRFWNGRVAGVYPEELPENIRELLDMEIPGLHTKSLGDLMPSYKFGEVIR